MDDGLGAELTEVLHEVVDERVVVVDHEHARSHIGTVPGRRPRGAGLTWEDMPQSKSKRSRYTPPAPKKAPPSKLWVPVSMFTCLVLGVVVIGGNYLQLLPGGEASNNFLVIGLVLLIAGFILSTFFR
jgi:hypothetical protein